MKTIKMSDFTDVIQLFCVASTWSIV